jgi:hypothetical protein
MSLNFYFGNVADYEQLHSDDRQWSITEHLIWHTMAVQMGSITEKNWKQFAKRYFAYHLVNQTPDNGKVTVADIKRRIGLSTNSGTSSDTKFAKYLADRALRHGEYTVQRSENQPDVC